MICKAVYRESAYLADRYEPVVMLPQPCLGQSWYCGGKASYYCKDISACERYGRNIGIGGIVAPIGRVDKIYIKDERLRCRVRDRLLKPAGCRQGGQSKLTCIVPADNFTSESIRNDIKKAIQLNRMDRDRMCRCKS